MSYFKVCPHCGAALDPGEVCDCRAKEEAPASAANAGGGGVEQTLTGPVLSYGTRETEELQA